MQAGTPRMAALATGRDDAFHRAKLATARFYFARLLPETAQRFAECRSGEPEWRTPSEHRVTAEIRDAEGDVVCRVTATWELGPRNKT